MKSLKLNTFSRTILSNLLVSGNLVSIPEKLDRDEYLQIKPALEALGGKWDRKSKAHVFPFDPTDSIDMAIETGEIQRVDPNPNDFYPTPEYMTKKLVEMLGVEKGMEVLEPSAGLGALAKAVATVTGDIQSVTCLDIAPDKVEALQNQGFFALRADFLSIMPTQSKFDRIIMNPPFTRLAAIHHVSHALDFLAEEGALVAIMPTSFEYREDKATKALRAKLDTFPSWYTQSNPKGLFKVSGTAVDTITLFVG